MASGWLAAGSVCGPATSPELAHDVDDVFARVREIAAAEEQLGVEHASAGIEAARSNSLRCSGRAQEPRACRVNLAQRHVSISKLPSSRLRDRVTGARGLVAGASWSKLVAFGRERKS